MLKDLIAVILLMTSAAGTAWHEFVDKGPKQGVEVEVEAPKQHEATSLRGNPQFVNLPAITIPTFRDNEVAGRITAELTLEMTGGRDVRRVEDNIRILQDAFTREMYALAEAESIGRLTINHGVMKTQLRAVGNRLLGDDVVDEVLIRTFVRSGR